MATRKYLAELKAANVLLSKVDIVDVMKEGMVAATAHVANTVAQSQRHEDDLELRANKWMDMVDTARRYLEDAKVWEAKNAAESLDAKNK